MLISVIPNMPKKFRLYLFGDNQEGNIACAREKFSECIDEICADEYGYGVHMGDAMDAFYVTDPRYHPFTVSASPLEQRRAVKDQLEPIAKLGRLLSVLEGNHEKALFNKAGNITEDLCKDLREISGTRYPISGTYTQKIEFLNFDAKPMCKVYVTHGRRSITSVSPDPHRRRAYMQFRLKRLLQNMAGDCILMARGHSHIVLVTPPAKDVYLSTHNGKLRQHYTGPGTGGSDTFIPPDYRWYGCTGSFLKSQVEGGVNTYSEIGEYEPVELGYLIAYFEDGDCVDLKEVKI